jgi:hypothetical protein
MSIPLYSTCKLGYDYDEYDNNNSRRAATDDQLTNEEIR